MASVTNYFYLIGPVGFIFLILALQVCSGFPPIYPRCFFNEDVALISPYMLALVATLIGSTIVIQLFIVFGLISFWCGLKVRRLVRERSEGPQSWVLIPLTIGVFNRWPLLLFDIWTIGFAATFGLIILL